MTKIMKHVILLAGLHAPAALTEPDNRLHVREVEYAASIMRAVRRS